MTETLLILAVGLLAYIVWNCFIGRFVYKKLYNGRMRLYMYVLFCVATFGVIVAFICASAKFNKERDSIYSALTRSPDNENVDALIDFLERNGCENSPNAWHKLRGVWFACNQSSNITTDKKQELQTYLMLKGLYLNNEERRIIKNYSK